MIGELSIGSQLPCHVRESILLLRHILTLYHHHFSTTEFRGIDKYVITEVKAEVEIFIEIWKGPKYIREYRMNHCEEKMQRRFTSTCDFAQHNM